MGAALAAVVGALLAAGVVPPHAATAIPAAMTVASILNRAVLDNITLTSWTTLDALWTPANVLPTLGHRLRSRHDRVERPPHRARAPRQGRSHRARRRHGLSRSDMATRIHPPPPRAACRAHVRSPRHREDTALAGPVFDAPFCARCDRTHGRPWPSGGARARPFDGRARGAMDGARPS